ncbi:glycosyltransferase [Rhodococcus tibetensis]|uniref:Glycosyltransferase n=1 Tax=Rhodococcus tibetensis TaxID=2965064 RepID=A0ABT1QF65_9NOCA|nr:glycosyltransferase [Rhodococcus sp. FXJ9.536]MCQ4120896.1 glycosyltransferase [Rhodococcus sp. FXJ9.536]
MSPTVTFLLSKDPTTEHGGDIALSRLVMRLAREHFDVRAVCLSGIDGDAPDGSLIRVPKPPVRRLPLLLDSVSSRRSLVHARFDMPGLVRAIESVNSDIYVAEHSYMAESYLRSATCASGARLVINTVNPESQVWKVTRGLLGRIEAPRILRDEIRVARAADAVGTYDRDEADFYTRHGVTNAQWIALTLEPAPPLPISQTGRRLVFLGTRAWPPNQEAFELALRWWPAISARIPGAELCVIGAPASSPRTRAYPAGVTDLGFVADLDTFLGTCRALIAPVATGGGVRVKILDAASRGVPVVGTTAAVGSLRTILELPVFDDRTAFVDQCRRYLWDRDAATTAGQRLYEVNARRWKNRMPHAAVTNLLRP